MTDTTRDDETVTDEAATDETATREATTAVDDRERDRGRDDRADDGGRDIATYVEWAAFGILCLLALVATFRFYFAASEAIRVWFSPDFVPVFQALFNLLVLVASAVGISVLVRRIA